MGELIELVGPVSSATARRSPLDNAAPGLHPGSGAPVLSISRSGQWTFSDGVVRKQAHRLGRCLRHEEVVGIEEDDDVTAAVCWHRR